MARACHQFPWAFAVAFGTPAAHEAAVVQEEPQQVKVRAAKAAILIGCLAALASPCELGLDVGRRF